MMRDLAILIPARNEEWLGRTVSDILALIRADTEIVVVLDGAWPKTPLDAHERVSVIYRPQPLGQRAATNEAARVANAPFIMKLDAHCTLDVGFDLKLLQLASELEPGVMQVPRQYNLHVFDWVCSCGWRKYQGPTPEKCPECGGKPERDVIWRRRRSTETTMWRFDRELHFQYWNAWKQTVRGQEKPASETMSLLGACWFVSREHYWQLGGLDEDHGSWGQMGTELACKWWLSGSRVVCNKNTWFAHMFRTQGGDFSFPYPISHRQTNKAREYSRDLWRAKEPDKMPKWKGAIRPLRWLLDHFAPVPGWEEVIADEVAAPSSEEEGKSQDTGLPPSVGPSGGSPTKGIVYYSDCRPERYLLDACAKKLLSSINGHRLAPVTLGEPPIHFHDYCVTIKKPEWQRGILTMFRQILAGLEALDTDIAFLCEHDVLYHPSHFEFVPERDDAFYYNENTYKVDAETGQAVFYYTKQTSGLCANRRLLVAHYHRRIAKLIENQRVLISRGERVKRDGYSRHMGFEPGCHMEPRGVDKYPALAWMSECPNVDIRHGHNLTPSRWCIEQFRNKDSCRGWKLADEIPGWGRTKGRFAEWLREVTG